MQLSADVLPVPLQGHAHIVPGGSSRGKTEPLEWIHRSSRRDCTSKPRAHLKVEIVQSHKFAYVEDRGREGVCALSSIPEFGLRGSSLEESWRGSVRVHLHAVPLTSFQKVTVPFDIFFLMLQMLLTDPHNGSRG